MFAQAWDPLQHLGMVLFTGNEITGEDFAKYLAGIDGAAKVLGPEVTDSAAVVIIDPSVPAFTVKQRAQIVEHTASLGARVINAVVVRSPQWRGALVAINWKREKSPYEDSVVVATLEEAITWVEGRRGPRRAAIEHLHRQVRFETGTSLAAVTAPRR
jgi:hypothetical protein